ncbi:class II bacteriocin [Terribacillus saccharophilus]|uniref:class II bacteriocin n=1 Tax=Terribacillus saccharophilus TaxID=361277 RepID=UPI003D36592E
MQQISGGAQARQEGGGSKTRSYGNGVYCNRSKCWVNWNETTQSVVKISIDGWVKSFRR